jgi:hypothetical protein
MEHALRISVSSPYRGRSLGRSAPPDTGTLLAARVLDVCPVIDREIAEGFEAARADLGEITVAGFRDWWIERTVAERIAASEARGVLVSTVHGAKGLERDRVVIVVPDLRAFHARADTDEAWRLLYVAVTRARFDLEIVVTDPDPRALCPVLDAITPRPNHRDRAPELSDAVTP